MTITTKPCVYCTACDEEVGDLYAFHPGCCDHTEIDTSDSADNGTDYHFFTSICTQCGSDVILTPDGWEIV